MLEVFRENNIYFKSFPKEMTAYDELLARIQEDDQAILEFINKGEISNQIDNLTRELLESKRIANLEEFFNVLYIRLLEIQKKENRRVHKGLPLHNIGLARFFMGLPGADRYLLLAYIEDCITSFEERESENPLNPLQLPAYKMLKYSLKISDYDLEQIKSNIDKIFLYPEEAFNKISRDIWLINQTLFDINTFYFNELLEKLEAVSKEYDMASKEQKRRLTTKVGRTFEYFVEYLFNSVNGFKVVGKNFSTRINEIDRIVENYSNNMALEKLGRYFIVECKNSSWRGYNPGSKVVDHLLMTMRRANCNMGILISKSGFANTVKKSIYLEFLKSGFMILPIDMQDLNRIKNGENFVTILLEKYNEIKFFKL